MSDKPKLVGITGGIGSGKSTICKILEVLGHKVYYADDRAKWLMENDPTVIKEVTNLFGEQAYVDGKLDRKAIAEKVFLDQTLLEQLNSIVHPAVGKDLANWVEDNRSENILFDEAALLFEIGSYKKMDATILVTAPEEVRVERVLARDPHRSKESIQGIIAQQMKDEDKIPLADFVIENDGSKSLINQTIAIRAQLLS